MIPPAKTTTPGVSSPIEGFFNKTNAPLSLANPKGGKIRLGPGEFVRDQHGKMVNDQSLLQFRPYGLEPKFREAAAPVPVAAPAAPAPAAKAVVPATPANPPPAVPGDVTDGEESTTDDGTEALRGGATLRVLDKAEISQEALVNPDNWIVTLQDGRYHLPVDNFVAKEAVAVKHHVKAKFGKEFAERLKLPR